jgi:beta-glucosidase
VGGGGQVAAAAAADVVVVALGEDHYAERNGDIDGAASLHARTRTYADRRVGGETRADLALPQGQYDFVAALAATGTPVVVVMVGGRTRLLKSLVTEADAILGGTAGGPRSAHARRD